MRGRKPLPTAIKQVNGYQKSKIDNENEPIPRALLSIADAPEYLSDDARIEWVRIIHELNVMGLLTTADMDIVAMVADVTARYKKAQAQVDTDGFLIETPNGYKQVHPTLAIVNKCIQQLQKLYVELGMSPSSRTRLKVPESHSEDEYEEYLSS